MHSEYKLSDLILSPDLEAICKKLRIRKLGDFALINEKDLQYVTKNTSPLIKEIEDLVQWVRANYVSPEVAASIKNAMTFPLHRQLNSSAQIKARIDSQTPHSVPIFSPVDMIFIPESERARSLRIFDVSARLRHVLDSNEISILGDLNGRDYGEIKKFKNCGRKSIEELRELVRRLQSGMSDGLPDSAAAAPVNLSIFVVPLFARDFLLSDLPLSARLENTLQQKAFKKLRDIDGLAFAELLNLENCGKKSVKELQELIRRAGLGEFSPIAGTDIGTVLHQVAASIDAGLTGLNDRDRNVFEERLGNKKDAPKTLEEIAHKFDITRERVRQIVKKTFEKIHRNGGPKLIAAVQALTRECEQRVCPLTADLFVKWLGDSPPQLGHESMFYVRVLDTMEPTVPAWPTGSTCEGLHEPESAKILTAVENWIRQKILTPTAAEAYAYLRQQPDFKDLSAGVFLTAIRIARKFVIDFPEVDRPRFRLRRLTFNEFAVPILEESSEPLTPEVIVQRAKARYGDASIIMANRSVFNTPAPERGLILLGPRSLGLLRHIQTPIKAWPAIRNHFAKLLGKEDRPISTTETVAQNKLAGFDIKSAHELAHILREDDRFSDLGRHLFGLASWGIQEREFVKDLLPRIFQEANQLLTVEQTLARITRLRSVSPASISSQIKNCPEIQSFGFGYYGLKTWGIAERRVILTDRAIVERAIRRERKPVRFKELCQILSVGEIGPEANLLWQSCADSSKLRRVPDQQSPETCLLHKQVSLEQTLATTFRTLQRPASPRDLQRELNANYGELFALIGLKELEQRLGQSALFVRDDAGNYSLDADVNKEEFDPETLCTAATKILSDSKEITGCDELIERLQLMELGVEDISEDMLASILRGAVGLKEVGDKKFHILTTT